MAVRRSSASDEVIGTDPVGCPSTSDHASRSWPLVGGIRTNHHSPWVVTAEGGVPLDIREQFRRVDLTRCGADQPPALTQDSQICGTGGTHGGSPRPPVREPIAHRKSRGLAATCGPSPWPSSQVTPDFPATRRVIAACVGRTVLIALRGGHLRRRPRRLAWPCPTPPVIPAQDFGLEPTRRTGPKNSTAWPFSSIAQGRTRRAHVACVRPGLGGHGSAARREATGA
jgi:hypothetical protein